MFSTLLWLLALGLFVLCFVFHVCVALQSPGVRRAFRWVFFPFLCSFLTNTVNRQLIDSILHIPGKIVGADLVEYNPTVDIDGITATCAAKLFQEMTGKIIDSHKHCA